uniref:Uncharacterized protein n=1 Tax=Pseudomonas fluorescens (strain SBW25) TaxID=216595 RepID=A4V7F2_PSEFS|nr:hypothetical protein [Pseudomonas fluorescens]CAM96489.1 hypothetical protein pQBR0457 [Pseudomonas fluorescens SBW25]
MESHAQTKQTWSPLQFPSAPLTALTIPHVSAAVQHSVAALFMREHGYLVDRKGHSAFCLEALQGGLLHESDLSPLNCYPNGYGLHLVTGKVVRSIESRVEFTREVAVPDAERIAYGLARKDIDITYASGIALSVAEAGLLHDSVLAPILTQGADCGYDLVNATKTALDALWPQAQRECRNVEGGTVYTDQPFYSHIQGNDFYLEACERNCFYLDWPELTQENLEMHILLTKTLDAMNTYLIPFHTPFTAFSCWGQYTGGVSESYEAIKDDVTGKSHAEIVEVLKAHDDLDELGWLGMEMDADEMDDASVERAASLLWQMDDVERNFKYQLTYGPDVTDENRKAELGELLSQAREISRRNSRESGLAQVLSDALNSCISRVDGHQPVDALIAQAYGDSEELGGYENSPNRFFDCIWVLADERHKALHVEAVEGFNADLEECADVTVKLPLNTGVLVAQVTVPIMERTSQCLELLRRIQLSLEVPANAQQ